jgi:hypothetical protein
MIPANDMLAILERDTNLPGRGFIEKTSSVGLKPMNYMNNINFSLAITSYLQAMAEKTGSKNISDMSLIELSQFIKKHKTGASKIIMGSQPLYGLSNRPSALNNNDFLAKTLLTFQSASLAGINSTRRAVELWRSGKIDSVKASTMIAAGFVVPAMWMALVSTAWNGFKEWLTPDDEEKLKEMEENSNMLMDYALQVTQEMSAQFPIVSQIVWTSKNLIQRFYFCRRM